MHPQNPEPAGQHLLEIAFPEQVASSEQHPQQVLLEGEHSAWQEAFSEGTARPESDSVSCDDVVSTCAEVVALGVQTGYELIEVDVHSVSGAQHEKKLADLQGV